jgi:4-hydroxythreonine-4-phosphate dehydrogenase
MKPTVGITLGCPCGIGPEVVAEALVRPRVRRRLVPVVFGDGPTFARFPSLRRLPETTLDGLRHGSAARVAVSALRADERRPGKPSRAAGKAQKDYIEAAVQAARRGKLDALCTAPVSKAQIAGAGFRFVGHTELLAECFGVEVLMLLAGPRLRVALATNHVALRDVPHRLTRARLVRQLKLLSRSLASQLGRRPRIAVCGLNPHAGDGGLLGFEDQRVVAPAVAAARRAGVNCRGPFAADGLFAQTRGMPYDAVLAMYHDQGLVAAKAVDFVRTVNITLGLPVPRTSPDHGTAYDIAGKGKADAEPMVEALLRAAELASVPWKRATPT